jgi:hypothetical protein
MIEQRQWRQWSGFVAVLCVAVAAAVLLLKTQKRTFQKVALDEASGGDESVFPFHRIGKHFHYFKEEGYNENGLDYYHIAVPVGTASPPPMPMHFFRVEGFDDGSLRRRVRIDAADQDANGQPI